MPNEERDGEAEGGSNELLVESLEDDPEPPPEEPEQTLGEEVEVKIKHSTSRQTRASWRRKKAVVTGDS